MVGKEMVDMKNFREDFVNKYEDEFDEYVEEFKKYIEDESNEIKMLKSEVAFLKKQYPNVTKLLEDGIETNLSDLDKNVIFRVYNLQVDIGFVVLKETLKMAVRYRDK